MESFAHTVRGLCLNMRGDGGAGRAQRGNGKSGVYRLDDVGKEMGGGAGGDRRTARATH